MNLDDIAKGNIRVIYPKTEDDEYEADLNLLHCKIHNTYREADGKEPCWACENKRIEQWEAEDELK